MWRVIFGVESLIMGCYSGFFRIFGGTVLELNGLKLPECARVLLEMVICVFFCCVLCGGFWGMVFSFQLAVFSKRKRTANRR